MLVLSLIVVCLPFATANPLPSADPLLVPEDEIQILENSVVAADVPLITLAPAPEPEGKIEDRSKFYRDYERMNAGEKDWKCGIGHISSGFTYALAYFTNKDAINQCCYEHDLLLEETEISRKEIDRVFCQCLDEINSNYVRRIIQPLFCNAVKGYSLLFPSHR